MRKTPRPVTDKRAAPIIGLKNNQASPSTRQATVPPTINAKIATARLTAIERSDPTRGINANNAIIGLNSKYQPSIDKIIAQGLIILPAVFIALSCSLNI